MRYPPGLDSYATRNTVALSLRFDRQPDLGLMKKFIAELQAQQFEVVTVTQVRQDRDVHELIARECNIAHIDWPQTRTHLDQESAVIETYSRCAAVVSNRLHALIIGGRYGAVPVIADSAGDNKLHLTLDALIGPQSVWLHGATEVNPGNVIDTSATEVERIRSAFSAAASSLEPALTTLVYALDANASISPGTP